MRKIKLSPMLLGLVLLTPALAQAQTAPATASTPPKGKLQVLVADSHNHLLLSPSDLKALPHIQITVQNPHNNEKEDYSGVRVSDLLSKLAAPLGKDLRGQAMASYILATGSDGYKVTFSIAEIDPEFHPGEIIVADEMNGKPLDAKAGPFKLVATEDKRPARWVRNLVSLELKTSD